MNRWKKFIRLTASVESAGLDTSYTGDLHQFVSGGTDLSTTGDLRLAAAEFLANFACSLIRAI